MADSPQQEPSPEFLAAPKNTQVGEGVSAFNINTFRTNATTLDSVLPKHSFLVTFAPFAATQKAAGVLNSYIVGTAATSLVMRCDSAQLPGVTALKDEVTRFGYGPVEDMTYGVQFADMTLGFIMDEKATHARFFNEWMNLITNFSSKGGGNMIKKNNLGYFPYDVSYKDDYSNLQMNITVFDRSQQQVLVYELYDVFPTSINATDVSWGDTDQLMRLYVRFAYTDFTVRAPKLDGYLPADNWQFKTPSEKPANPNEEPFKLNWKPNQTGSAFADLGAITGIGVTPVSNKNQATYISPDPNNPNQIVVTAGYTPKPPSQIISIPSEIGIP